MAKREKNISCPVRGKKSRDMDLAWNHIQRKHPESRLSPKVKDASLPSDILDPTAAAVANQDMDEPDKINVVQPLGKGPIVFQLSYSLSGGSPWRVLDNGQRRVLHYHALPETRPSGINVNRIQGLPGKAETISNVVIKELNNSLKQTQAIILSPSREAAQTTQTLVSSSAASASVTTHLSVGGSNIHEDMQRLKERPHIVIATIGRIVHMLKRKIINPPDIKILCVDNIQYFLSSSQEDEFVKFCEHLAKDIEVVFLLTKVRYKTSHDLSTLFIREPLHFLVKEDPAPNTSPIPHESPVPLGTHDVPLERFYCQEYECGRGFSSEAHLESHTRFFHPRKPTKTVATALSNDIPDADEKSTEHSPAYSSPTSTASYPHPGEPATQDSPGHIETYVPVLRQEGYQGAELNTGGGVQQTHEGPLELPTTSQTGVHATPAVTVSTPLSLQCRMCDAPPTVGTRPTVTMCGHLFCSECITRHVISTSRCPVCDNALLLYCLFKLDLPVSSQVPKLL